MRTLLCLTATTLLALAATAQTVVIPAGLATTEGNTSNAFPWGRGGSGLRIQNLYDSTNFTSQGITFPIRINRLRWRVNASTARTWVATSYQQATVTLSTCPLDQNVASTVMANNVGLDAVVVHNGPFSFPAGATTPPGPATFDIDLPLTTPFVYDPSLGDLNIDTDLPIQTFSGTSVQLDVQSTNSLSSRVYVSTGYPTGTVTRGLNHGVVVEVGYTPTSGLFAFFSATPTTGPSPLIVAFTDQSFTSDPGGITSYAWDFDGDSVIDSTLQNPSFIYANCGSYSVSLTVTDASHAPHTLTRTNYIVTDGAVTPSFTSAPIVPGVLQFTDTSTPVPTSWAWDFDGDNVVDSTAQNPIWPFGTNCRGPVDVTLSVNRLCRGPFSVTQRVSPGTSFETLRTGTTSTTNTYGGFFDVNVTNPYGVFVCAMEMKTTATASTPVNFEVHVTPGTWVGSNANASVWRLVGTGSTTGATGSNDLEFVTFASPFYLAPGTYGVWAKAIGFSPSYTTQTATQTFTGADMSITTGAVGVLGATGLSANRVWNGAFYYSTCGSSLEAGYGFFARGCAGTLPVSTQAHTSRPVLGTTLNVNVNNLPFDVAIMAVGLSRTTSPFGPLPLDLTPFGAPGCQAHVSPDATAFVTGSGGSATWSFALPNNPALVCIAFYAQHVVIDPTANAFSAVLGDAAAAITGTN